MNSQNQHTEKETQDLSNTPAQGTFKARPFVVQAQKANQEQQPDLKTSLIQAKHYGHNLNQINASVSNPEALQPKMEIGTPVQLAKKKKKTSTAAATHTTPASTSTAPATTSATTAPAMSLALAKTLSSGGFVSQKGAKLPLGQRAGGSNFGNHEGKLPKKDSAGKPITYKEYDVNPKNPVRDAERIVVGSDGIYWHTTDHYASFTQVK